MTGPSARPNSIEAEESVIGGTLLHPDAFDVIAQFLAPTDFYHPALKAIYAAMLELRRASKPIDTLTVSEQLKSSGEHERLHAFGGSEYLVDLMNKVITVENLEYHARIVVKKSDRRRWFAATLKVQAAAISDDGDDDFLEMAERTMLEVSNDNRDTTGPVHVKPITKAFLLDLEQRHKRISETHSTVTGVATGLRDFDELSAGLQDGDLVVIAARPSMGKSAFMMRAVDGAADAGVHCLVISLEMSSKRLVERLIAANGRVDSDRLRSAQLAAPHWIRVSNGTSRVVEKPIWIDDTNGLTMLQIASRARRWALKEAKGKKRLVAIDYLGLVRAESRGNDNREQEVAAMSRAAKDLAKDLGCPVMLLSQLNRGLENRPDKRPRMSDIRESGAVEQDADLIGFLYRDEVYSKEDCADEDKGVAEIIIAKQRMGPIGTVRAAWLPEFATFENLPARSAP